MVLDIATILARGQLARDVTVLPITSVTSKVDLAMLTWHGQLQRSSGSQ